MHVILFHGSKYAGVIILFLFIVFQIGLLSFKREIKYEIKKNQKQYSLLQEELETKNKCAIKDEL